MNSYRFIKAHHEHHPVRLLCHELGVVVSGYLALVLESYRGANQ